MFNKSLADQAVQNADTALDNTHSAASQALDSISKSVEHGVARVREAGQQVRTSAARASEGTVDYIRHDPVKSVLIAAATGAALMALVSLLTRQSNRH